MSEVSFKDLTSPAFSEPLQVHNALTFKLVKTVADFTQQLSALHDRQAEDLTYLVEAFRKRSGELRKERSACQSSLFTVWEHLLHEVELESCSHGDIARNLSHTLGTGLLEKTFHKKIQSRKAFLHRESLESILSKAEDTLAKCYMDYCGSWKLYSATKSPQHLAEYYDAHNNYVQQLHATNGMLRTYRIDLLPCLLEDVETSYLDTSSTISSSVQSTIEFLAAKSREQGNHYQTISSACKAVNGKQDLIHFIKSLTIEKNPAQLRIHSFNSPALSDDNGAQGGPSGASMLAGERPMLLQNEVIVDRGAHKVVSSKTEALRLDITALEAKVRKLEETLDNLTKLQLRSMESNLFNKVNEIQEDISGKQFDLHVSVIHLAAVKSQLELYLLKEREMFSENGLGNLQGARKASTTSTTSIKNKWLKAFKSLKTPGSSSSTSNADKNEAESRFAKGMFSDVQGHRFSVCEGQHVFQEYTYKKITPCDVCREVLRGHSRQGLKCKMCKLNVHATECLDRAPKCQPKQKLLRRQKSTSEIEAKMPNSESELSASGSQQQSNSSNSSSVDPVYQLLRAAVEVRRDPKMAAPSDRWSAVMGQMGLMPPHLSRVQSRSSASSSGSSSCTSSHLLAVNTNPLHVSSCSAPHSPQRKKMSLRMKSFSLDESTQGQYQTTRYVPLPPQPATAGVGGPGSSSMSSSMSAGAHHHPLALTQTATPMAPETTSRRMAPKLRMSSVEIPDANEKSSASPSPCPSPKPQRLLPTNLYVVLYNFRSRHEDELDLKAGATLTVTDTSALDWWQGKLYGQTGYFPSKYVAKLYPGEKPLQMVHTIQVSDGESMMKLLRDQVIIQVGDEVEGTINVRTGVSEKTVPCPVQYVQEV